MLRHPPDNEEENRKRYARKIEDTYTFDSESGLYQPKAYAERKHREQEQPGSNERSRFFTDPKRDWVTIFVGIATLIVVGLYTHYARLQWYEMKRTAEQASAATTLAQQTLAENKRQFAASHRPYIWIVEERGDGLGPFQMVPSGPLKGRLAFNFTFKNYGSAPAVNLRSQAWIVFGDNGWKKAPWTIIDKTTKGTIMAPTGEAGNTAFSESPVAPSLYEQITKPGIIEKVEVVGRIIYFDESGTEYTTDFCVGRGPELRFYNCPYHNSIN
jgi:hypothetical protein